MAVYSRAGVPGWGIRASAALLGAGGILLLFPQAFRLGATLLAMHSLFTIACFVIVRNWRGSAGEALMLQIPVLLLWIGYPRFALDAVAALFRG